MGPTIMSKKIYIMADRTYYSKIFNRLIMWWQEGPTVYHGKRDYQDKYDQQTVIAKGPTTYYHGKRDQQSIMAKGINKQSWQKRPTIMSNGTNWLLVKETNWNHCKREKQSRQTGPTDSWEMGSTDYDGKRDNISSQNWPTDYQGQETNWLYYNKRDQLTIMAKSATYESICCCT